MIKSGLFTFVFLFSGLVAQGQLKSSSYKKQGASGAMELLLKKKAASVQGNQTLSLMLPAPEQDCIAAIPLCDSTYTQTNSYTGQGNIPNEIDASASCLLSGEKNDVWYTFTVQNSGNLNFSISPLNGNDDYDWALFNLTNHVCADIFNIPSLEVSCNYAPNLGCGGVTGPNNNITGTCGGQNELEVPVLTGEVYVINVSNFSSTQFGYTIDFSASTATIYDDVPPLPTVSGMNCTDSSFIISFPSELISCSSIALDGSDFLVYDLSGNILPVYSAVGIGCSPTQPYVSQILITLPASSVAFPGFYLITKNGTDGNSFSDKCGNFAGDNGYTDTVAFVNVLNNILVNLGSDTSICAADPKPLLNALNNGAGFSWSYNGTLLSNNSQTLLTNFPGTYIVTVSYGAGCIARDTMNLSFLPSFTFNLGNDTAVCQGSPFPLLQTGISNALQYQWFLNNIALSGAVAGSYQPLSPGTYMAIVDSGLASCPGIDTLIITAALPAAFDLGNNIVFCEDDSALIKAGVNSQVNYQWYLQNNLLPYFTDSIFALIPGTYTLQVITTDLCLSTDSVLVNMEMIAGKPTVKCPQNTGTSNIFNWLPVPGATGYEISLDGITGWTVPSSGTLGLSHTTPLLIKTIYVHALSGSFCPPGQASSSLPCDIIISNILTPNADDKNDFFFVLNIEQFPGTSVTIYNRWGIKVFVDEDYRNNWNGDDLAQGVYFYIVSIKDQEVKTGTLTLIR